MKRRRSAYVVTDSLVLPVDVEFLGLFPHAHYLCKEMKCTAVLPDGTRRWLLNIPDLDFDWQDDYHYAEPVFLPRGTTVSMQFTYDNSVGNLRNPNSPPRCARESVIAFVLATGPCACGTRMSGHLNERTF